MTGGHDAAHRLDVLFVYGTLRPGESRWPHLAPFVVDEGWSDSTAGRLFDTGRGYPAALFDAAGPDDDGDGHRITGQAFLLLQESRTQALDLLDDIEGAVWGLYRRVIVTTQRGVRAFAYEYGGAGDPAGRDGGDGLRLIPSGDWRHRT